MERDHRYKHLGFIFYIVLFCLLASTQEGVQAIERIMTKDTGWNQEIYIVLIAAGFTLFSSETAGFIINSVAMAIFNLLGGYSKEVQIPGSALKDRFLRDFDPATTASFPSYEIDVFFSCYWQFAPEELRSWVTRRHNAFFTGGFIAFAITVAVVTSDIIIACFAFKVSQTYYYALAFSALLLIAMIYNAHHARRDAIQMIDLYVHTQLLLHNPVPFEPFHRAPDSTTEPDQADDRNSTNHL
jgi:hypothetical protein